MSQRNVKIAKHNQNNNAREGSKRHVNNRGQMIPVVEDTVEKLETVPRKTVTAEWR